MMYLFEAVTESQSCGDVFQVFMKKLSLNDSPNTGNDEAVCSLRRSYSLNNVLICVRRCCSGVFVMRLYGRRRLT